MLPNLYFGDHSMEDINTLVEVLKKNIIEKFREMKTDLFLSNGTIYGRDWPDLTDRYKQEKYRAIGKIYPMNMLYEELLKSLLDKAFEIETTYFNDEIKLSLSVDTDRMVINYANRRNEDRNYVTFSDEEKELLILVCKETVQKHFESIL